MTHIRTIEIQAKGFFDLLKEREQSMWTVFAEMLREEEEQLILFLDEEGGEIAHYILPAKPEQLQEDQRLFADSFKEKLRAALG